MYAIVCLVEKRNGHLSFPKGSIGRGEGVRASALREWLEEAGLDLDRLALLQDAFVDDPKFGCRYLFAVCRAATPGGASRTRVSLAGPRRTRIGGSPTQSFERIGCG